MLVLLFLAALWVLAVADITADGFETLVDGKIYDLTFTAENDIAKFTYQAIDPKATFSFTVYPTDENNMDEEFITVICRNSSCTTNGLGGAIGYMNFEMPTVDTQEYNFNMVDKPIYIIMEGRPGVSVSLFAMSSIVLKNEKVVSINPKTDDDGYDYKANNYVRWFRVFACDRDDYDPNLDGTDSSKNNPGKIVFGGYAKDFGMKAYVNFWNSDEGDVPGRPSGTNGADATYVGQKAEITKSNRFIYPGWVFIGIDFSEVYNNADANMDEYFSLDITADLENPKDFLTRDAPYSTALCFYEDCYEFTRFKPSDFLYNSEGEEEDIENLYFVSMFMDKYAHEHGGILTLEAMSSTYYEEKNHIHKTGQDGYLEFNSDDISIMRGMDLEDMFVATSTTNMNKFMLPIHGISANDPNLNIVTTIVPNTSVVRMGHKAYTYTTNLIDDWSTHNHNPVYGRRLILDTAGVNKPYYLVDTYDDGTKKPDIECNYYVDVRSHDGVTDVTDVNAGVYVGNGYAKFPNYSTNSNGDPENKDYAFPSKNFKANVTEGIPMDTQVIRMEKGHNEFYQDGTYILDVWDAPTTSDFKEKTGIQLDVVAHPSWFVTSNQEYGKMLNGESTYDYFIFKTSDISQGINVYVELIDAVESDSSVGVYASFVSLLPTSESKFVQSGHYYASLNIPASAFDEYEDVAQQGQYIIYIAINTTHKGEMKFTVFEGMGQIVHIGDGESIELDLNINSNNDDMRVIMFHSSEDNNLSELAVVVEGVSEEWNDDIYIKACVYDELFKIFSLCMSTSGYITNLSSSNKKGTIYIPLPEEAELHPDYFIHLMASKNRTSATTQNMITVKVFGEDYDPLTSEDEVTVTVDYKLEPILLKFFTQEDMDYVLNLTVVDTRAPNSVMKLRVCSDFPPESSNVPPDVDDDNKRNCISETLSYGGTLSIDLIGDTIINDNTVINDLPFITSLVKYAAIYPVKASIGSTIQAELYEDVHVRANNNLTLLNGKYDENAYFRLLILSRDSVSGKDFLSFEFSGDYPVQYCVSAVPHVNIGDSKCKAGLVNYTPGTQKKPTVDILRLADIDPSYNGKVDVSVYFTFFFPEGVEDNPSTLKTRFANTVVHYLPVIKSSDDNIDDDTLFFEMSNGKRMSFYTMNFEYGEELRFFILPDVKDTNGIEDNTGSYTTSKIAITHLYDIRNEFPTPSVANADLIAAGIISHDFVVTESYGFNGGKFAAFTAEFIESTISNPYGLYKAGFVSKDDFGTAISQMTTMVMSKPYHFAYDPTDPNQPEGTPTGRTFYYPYISTDNILIVSPCAGIPGVNTSFVSANPKATDRTYSKSYPGMGHKIGYQYFAPFINYLNNGQDPILLLPTGHIFNATFENGPYVDDPDHQNHTRWSADMIIVSGDGKNSNGGPRITNTDVKIASHRGAEVVVEFAEAISGYAADPTITKTHIEYALFAMPAPKDGSANPNFDASPNTGCGMINYGFPLTVDSKNNVSWVKGTIDSNADGSNPDSNKIASNLTLTSNFNPDSYKYPSGVRPNFDETTNKNTSIFNVNVVAREVRDDITDEADKIIGYSAYNAVKVEISGSLPVSPGGLFPWEITVIVIVVLIVVAVVVIVVMVCISRKRQAMGYGNLDGHGNNTNKHGLNVDLPDDDLSISASTTSSKGPDNNMPSDDI